MRPLSWESDAKADTLQVYAAIEINMARRLAHYLRSRPASGIFAIAFVFYLGGFVSLLLGLDGPLWAFGLLLPVSLLYGLFLAWGWEPLRERRRRPGAHYHIPWAGVPWWKKPIIMVRVMWWGLYYFWYGVFPHWHDKR